MPDRDIVQTSAIAITTMLTAMRINRFASGVESPHKSVPYARLRRVERTLDSRAQHSDRQTRRHHHPAREVIPVDERAEPVLVCPLLRLPEAVHEAVLVLAAKNADEGQRHREQHEV